jgi:uncharacterized protein (DUF2147 family)
MLSSAIAQCAIAQKFTGKWLVQKKDGVVEIFKKGNIYYGKVIEGKNLVNKDGSFRKDIKNPSKSKRNRAIKNMIFLANFKKQGEELVGGTLYDSRTGKSYKGKIWLEAGKLKVRGYLGIFYETRTWTRAK